MAIIKKYDIRKIKRYTFNIRRLEKLSDIRDLDKFELEELEYYKENRRRLQIILNYKLNT